MSGSVPLGQAPAAACALREVRRNDRPSLGWDRRLLQAREQGLARIRGGAQQQDPRYPASRLRSARRGIPAAESSHLHAPKALRNPQNHPLDSVKSPNSERTAFLFAVSELVVGLL